LSAIEEGIFDVDEIKADYNQYLGFVFENVAKEFLIELNKIGKLPFKFLSIGRWWHKGEEIDLIALNKNEKKALFVEVKWRDLKDKDVKKIFKDLERKSKLVGLDDYEKHYAVIGKRIENKDFKDCLLFDLDDFDKYL
jgi:AAA+ ATPase superfamily predicted ATPase